MFSWEGIVLQLLFIDVMKSFLLCIQLTWDFLQRVTSSFPQLLVLLYYYILHIRTLYYNTLTKIKHQFNQLNWIQFVIFINCTFIVSVSDDRAKFSWSNPNLYCYWYGRVEIQIASVKLAQICPQSWIFQFSSLK